MQEDLGEPTTVDVVAHLTGLDPALDCVEEDFELRLECVRVRVKAAWATSVLMEAMRTSVTATTENPARFAKALTPIRSCPGRRRDRICLRPSASWVMWTACPRQRTMALGISLPSRVITDLPLKSV